MASLLWLKDKHLRVGLPLSFLVLAVSVDTLHLSQSLTVRIASEKAGLAEGVLFMQGAHGFTGVVGGVRIGFDVC